MLYFSNRALNEIDDARHTSSTSGTAAVSGRVATLSATLSREDGTNLDSPGSVDKVDFALERCSRRDRRRVFHDVHSVTHDGCIVDVEVEELRVGVMPFLYFGDYGESEFHDRKVRTFWSYALVPGRRWRKPREARELILLGSLDNVVNGAWSLDQEKSLKIGYDYPSEPYVLARLIRAELVLTGDSVQEHIESWDEACVPGALALSASEASRRPKPTSEYRSPEAGYVQTWDRRRPLRKARVVAICNDIGDADQESPAKSAVLARPVLIQDLT
jgi:hypothetical protein